MVQPSKELKIVTRLREQHAAAHELQGMSKAAIGRKLGLYQGTVHKLVNARSADDVVAKNLQRAHAVDPYIGYLHRRWNEGVRNAAQLDREIQELGYPEASWPSSVTCGATGPGADTHPPRAPSLHRSARSPKVGQLGYRQSAGRTVGATEIHGPPRAGRVEPAEIVGRIRTGQVAGACLPVYGESRHHFSASSTPA
ncbi:hypothetical protein [Streptomyces sp. NPDC097981]|uniref:hypothetical protein n=1 Tax=Streptomyces sp. NPDC097981 TaxID=3155428 RepID=UPI003331A3DA